MNKISVSLVSALVVVAAIVGLVVGYYQTPEYKLSMYDKGSMDLGRADKWLDLRYTNAMIAHHRGAMLLAEQAKISQRPEVKDLSAKILADEPKAIAELYNWKKSWYGDVKKVKDPTVANLGTYDEKFDLRFLNALIAHHQAGLVMTADVRKKTSRTEVLNNADAVEAFLTNTLEIFKGWRAGWYNVQ